LGMLRVEHRLGLFLLDARFAEGSETSQDIT
jgi:hypothetical protein